MDKFTTILADALEMDSAAVKGSDKFREYEEWDSLAVLSVIAMLKQNYGITIPRKEFDTLLTIEELYSYISANKG